MDAQRNKESVVLKLSNDERSSQSHVRSGHPGHLDASVNPRRTKMLKRPSILMLIAASALATTALVPEGASAKNFSGASFRAPASARIAATNGNVGGFTRGRIRSTVKTVSSPITTKSAHKTVAQTSGNALVHSGGPLNGANMLAHKTVGPMGNGNAMTPTTSGPLGKAVANNPNQGNQGTGAGNQLNQGGTGNQANQGTGAGNQLNQGGKGNQANQGTGADNQANQGGTDNHDNEGGADNHDNQGGTDNQDNQGGSGHHTKQRRG